MTRMRMVALLGFLLVSAAAAQTCGGKDGLPAGVKPGLYRGTVAGIPAVLQLGAASQYAYERRGLTIELKATQSSGKLVLQESIFDAQAQQDRATACFTLAPSGTGLTGLWTKYGQKGGAPVKFNLVDVLKVPLALPATPGLVKLRRDDPLHFLLINHAWQKAAGGKSITEPLSGLKYLRLPGESAALNNALQDRQMGYALNRLDCLGSSDPAGVGNEFNVSTGALFLTSKLLSFNDSVEYYCGGAHPDAYNEGVMLDRLTGEKVSLDTIWYSLDTGQQHKLYLATLPAKLDAECRDALKTRDTPGYTASLTQGGLQLIPTDLPHVAQACAEAVVIPYAKLKDDANTESVYYHDLYR